MRKQIQTILSNQSLSQQERARQIQMLMLNKPQDYLSNQSFQPNNSPTYFDEGAGILGCKHYKKNCKIQAACCKMFFTCRRCHDEEIQDHKINRYEIETMMCMFCNTIQPVAQNCMNCSKSMSRYYCGICKFFDDDADKQIFHCHKCGLCRIGKQR